MSRPEQHTQGTEPIDPIDPALAVRGRLRSGPGILLICVYGLLALAATGRSILQISEYFDRAPVSYLLSALAAVIYIVVTVGLARGGRASVRLATAALVVELAGVLVVGAISYAAPEAFPDKTVWSHFGAGYGYFPLILPILGLWWIHRQGRAGDPAQVDGSSGSRPSDPSVG